MLRSTPSILLNTLLPMGSFSFLLHIILADDVKFCRDPPIGSTVSLSSFNLPWACVALVFSQRLAYNTSDTYRRNDNVHSLLLSGPPMRWNVFLTMDDTHGVSSHVSLTHWCHDTARDVCSHQSLLLMFPSLIGAMSLRL